MRRIPELDRAIDTATCQQAAASVDGHREHTADVTLEGLQQLAGGGIPELQQPVITAADDDVVRVVDGNRAHRLSVAAERRNWNVPNGIPDHDGAIVAAAYDPLPVGSQRHVTHTANMSRQRDR